jgi:gluconolactonase
VTDRVRPNGLAFSPDEATLYVADTGASHVEGHPRTITAYAVDGGRASAVRELAGLDEGFFDGLRCDAHGNIWTSAGRSVRRYAPDGTHLGTLPMPEIVSNLCFGGAKRNRLFVTAQTSLYAIFLNVRGCAAQTSAAATACMGSR